MTKKVLVTGGAGFLGSHLVDNLLNKGYQVTIFDRRYDHDKFNEYKWTGRVGCRLGDLKDRDVVFDAVRHSDITINLAGLLGTQEMIDNPIPAVDVNIKGALNVFDAIKQFGVRGLQIAVGNYWMNNPYSITKSTAERFALMYNKEKGTDIRVIRAMNVYGERQLHKPIRKIFPNIVIPALLNKDITIYGSGEQVMDLIYVKDAVELIARAATYDNIPNNIVYEAGVGEMTINEAVEKVLEIINSKSKVHKLAMRPGEEENAVVKISAEGWKNLNTYLEYYDKDLTPLQQAFETTIEWYKMRLTKFNWEN